jgi:hypothetical protein
MVDGYQLLANAIVAQTAEDYREALVKEHYGVRGADSKIKYFKKWFAGEDCKILTNADGVALMEAIKAEVKAFKYDLKALYKSHNKT